MAWLFFQDITKIKEEYKTQLQNVQGTGTDKDKEKLKKITLDGHTIGSHTYSHQNLAILNENDLLFEIVNSKKRYPWIDSEDLYHPNVVIISDGHKFKETHELIAKLDALTTQYKKGS